MASSSRVGQLALAGDVLHVFGGAPVFEFIEHPGEVQRRAVRDTAAQILPALDQLFVQRS